MVARGRGRVLDLAIGAEITEAIMVKHAEGATKNVQISPTNEGVSGSAREDRVTS